jgi:hypothetical protein
VAAVAQHVCHRHRGRGLRPAAGIDSVRRCCQASRASRRRFCDCRARTPQDLSRSSRRSRSSGCWQRRGTVRTSLLPVNGCVTDALITSVPDCPRDLTDIAVNARANVGYCCPETDVPPRPANRSTSRRERDAVRACSRAACCHVGLARVGEPNQHTSDPTGAVTRLPPGTSVDRGSRRAEV